MNEAALAYQALRAGLGLLTAFRTWKATASPEQVKALVAEIHAAGGTVDLAAVDGVLSSVLQSGADLDAKIASRA
jgi:hypothetical protein